MNKQDLLMYVRELRVSQAERSSKRGVTTWALGAGIVYLIWHIIPHLEELAKLANWRLVLYQNFSYVSIALLTGCALLRTASSELRKSPLDYRVRPDPLGDLPLMLFILLLVFGAPLYCSLYAIGHLEITGFPMVQLKINAAALGIIGSLTILAAAVQIISKIKTGYPHPAMLSGEETLFSKVTDFAIKLIFAVLFLGNAYSSLLPLGHTPEQWSLIITTAFDASLILLATTVAFVANIHNRDAEALSRIERDIVLHDLSETEIKSRIEVDLLGQSFGTWISEKISVVKERSARLEKLAREHATLLKEVETIEPEFFYERQGRIGEYIAKLEKARSEFLEPAKPLIRWLNTARRGRHAFSDIVISRTLDEATDELLGISESLLDVVDDATKALERKLKDIPNETQGTTRNDPAANTAR